MGSKMENSNLLELLKNVVTNDQSVYQELKASIMETNEPGEEHIVEALIYVAGNRYREAIAIFQASPMTDTTISLEVLTVFLNPQVNENEVLTTLRKAEIFIAAVGEPSFLFKLSLSFAYRALGDVEKAAALFPHNPEDIENLRPSIGRIIRAALVLDELYSHVADSIGVWLMEQGTLPRARLFFMLAVSHKSSGVQPLLNYALCCCKLRDWDLAIVILEKAIALKADIPESFWLMGKILRQTGKGDPKQIFNLFSRAFELDRGNIEYAISAAKTLVWGALWEQLLEYTRVVLNEQPNEHRILSYRGFAAAQLCDWKTLENEDEQYKTMGLSGESIADPFVGLLFDASADNQKIRATRYVAKTITDLDLNLQDSAETYELGNQEINKKLRIGIFSSDFYNHAGMTLMLDFFKSFDRNSYEILAFKIGDNIDDEITHAIKKWCTKYLDCTDMSVPEIQELAKQKQLDIAIDRGSHTGSNKISLFAQRLARIQISYLAYPSTTGAPFIDYLVGDCVVTPETSFSSYTECIIQLPVCYQPNSKHIFPEPPEPKWPAELPQDRLVIANFNTITKIRSNDLSMWAKLLNSHPTAVLWLISDSEIVRKNIKEYFQSKNIHPERIIFSAKVEWKIHQSRIQHADLCVDTRIYGSHTTALDCLAAGVPIITIPGSGFQTRVCASILLHLGLSKLVCETEDQAIDLASDLLNNDEKRARLKIEILRLMDKKEIEKRSKVYWNYLFNGFREALRIKDTEGKIKNIFVER